MNKENFNYYVNQFKHENVAIHYFYYRDNENIFSHSFNDYQKPCDIRSISKTVMALTLGLAIDDRVKVGESYLNQDSYIYPIIKDLITVSNKNNLPFLKKVQIKHLLNHTVGFDRVLLMRDDIRDKDPFTLLDYIINSPIVHQPGSHYLYSNAGFYLLSVVLQEVLKMPLEDYIKNRLFQPLDILEAKWEKYGNYLAGATRLWLYPDDLAKIGLLILQNGRYENKEIISKAWLDFLKTEPIITEHVDNSQRLFRRYAYGKGLWLAKEKEIVFGHGTDGQTLITVPSQNAVIVTLSQEQDPDKLESVLDNLLKSL